MKVRLFFSTGMVGGRREEIMEIPDSEVEGMDEDQLDEHLSMYALDFMWNYVDCGHEVLEG